MGVNRSASHDQVRTAYRDLARRLHPDRQANASTAERALAERRMREINEAWKVLGDRAARQRYDQALDRAGRVGTRPPVTPRTSASRPGEGRRSGRTQRSSPIPVDDEDLIDVEPELGPTGSMVMRALPWVAVAGVLVIIFVVTAYATAGRHDSPTTAPRVVVGTCVRITSETLVPSGCGEPGALRLVKQVALTGACPQGSEARYLPPKDHIDCVTAPSRRASPSG